MERDGIRLKFFGDTSVLSDKLRSLIHETDDITAHLGKTFQANVCVNYGGRDEIVRAARAWAARVKAGEDAPLDEEIFSSLLDSAGIPEPELLIRPGGEQRISNFLLWQSAYSELIFTDTLWPDFTEKDIDAAIAEYARRSRRFGGL